MLVPLDVASMALRPTAVAFSYSAVWKDVLEVHGDVDPGGGELHRVDVLRERDVTHVLRLVRSDDSEAVVAEGVNGGKADGSLRFLAWMTAQTKDSHARCVGQCSVWHRHGGEGRVN